MREHVLRCFLFKAYSKGYHCLCGSLLLLFQTFLFYVLRPKNVRFPFGDRTFLGPKTYGFGTETVKWRRLKTDCLPFENRLLDVCVVYFVHLLSCFIGLLLLYLQSNIKYMFMKEKKTKEEKQKNWQDFLDKLKNMPPEKLSKAAKWVLKQEEKGEEYWMDMKAVLK